ncbi:hypothetical protein VOLCADRAFT_107279 [Volvox carteri f. nagariensis]|uniref:Uncharacterized protein n=1 Tax=Volvox carteri f. nagariensis TaxID=3068 RepID=D8UCY2_VOLCA|nr:uncharacterized protein VOLCADRAFT_107279 [Volvox carteri f. nagariensis]EFJ42469.1 hypothetical protein VOLCADRAFT_107279 [Volvox carteri f. nagariensis]|eukprot:XP_002956532.1 hypothetical protein VOLCADRAFT_107279 [Volvox carteri f. nagariensis]
MNDPHDGQACTNAPPGKQPRPPSLHLSLAVDIPINARDNARSTVQQDSSYKTDVQSLRPGVVQERWREERAPWDAQRYITSTATTATSCQGQWRVHSATMDSNLLASLAKRMHDSRQLPNYLPIPGALQQQLCLDDGGIFQLWGLRKQRQVARWRWRHLP